MTPREYIEKKNSIIEKYTGIVLVPEDQIIDLPVEQVGKLSIHNGDEPACPYCIVYGAGTCKDCPMHEAGNGCTDGSHSTYRKVLDTCDEYVDGLAEFDAPWYDELDELIEEYNNELESI